jgi:dTDP-glucose 4,6-dehydratase
MRELRDAPDKPYVFHLGAQAHVGESWHRPYETVMANTVGTLNLLQSIVDNGLELEKFDTAGTSEEYGNVREAVAHHHDFDEDGALILHERSPINPKSIYATAKVAADFLTMNYHDAYGVPGVVTRMFNNYGPRQNPRYVTGTIITQALERETVESGRSSRCVTSAFAPTAYGATSWWPRKGSPATSMSMDRERTSRSRTGRPDPRHRA